MTAFIDNLISMESSLMPDLLAIVAAGD